MGAGAEGERLARLPGEVQRLRLVEQERGWDALTRTERKVAEHVAAGLSTNDVAALLFVSPRTVQSHLTRPYDKLGVRSRVQLARAVHRLEVEERAGAGLSTR